MGGGPGIVELDSDSDDSSLKTTTAPVRTQPVSTVSVQSRVPSTKPATKGKATRTRTASPMLPARLMAAEANRQARVDKGKGRAILELSDDSDDEPMVISSTTIVNGQIAIPVARRHPQQTHLPPTQRATPADLALATAPVQRTPIRTGIVELLEEMDPTIVPEPEEPQVPIPEPSDNDETVADLLRTAVAKPEDPVDTTLAGVLEIIPDVETNFVREAIITYMQTAEDFTRDTMVAQMLHQLFENPTYPKVDKRNKHKRKSEEIPVEQPAKKQKLDYLSLEREPGRNPDFSMYHLSLAFPFVRIPYLRKTLAMKRWLYAPTFVHLTHEQAAGTLVGNKVKGTRTRKDYKWENTPMPPEFEAELRWANAYAGGTAVLEEEGGPEQPVASGSGTSGQDGFEDSVECEEGEGVECGCCFSTYKADTMVQCDEGHLFCRGCTKAYASERLGQRITKIKCMQQAGCDQLFPYKQLQACLPPKLLMLYDRVKQEEEIMAAGIDCLEECPFCDFKCVIENEEEKLFRCLNEDICGVVSCRKCKKNDHLPKSCEEAEKDNVLDAQHSVEEAMSKALMRNCPKCSKSYLKEGGCNKISCPTCGALSCYICRKLISGYEHFNQTPGGQVTSSTKCPLWDGPDNGKGLERRHLEEVRRAQEQALAAIRQQNPGVDVREINVPVQGPAPIRPQAPVPQVPPAAIHIPPVLGIAPQAGRGRRRRVPPVHVPYQPQPQPQPGPAAMDPFIPYIPQRGHDREVMDRLQMLRGMMLQNGLPPANPGFHINLPPIVDRPAPRQGRRH